MRFDTKDIEEEIFEDIFQKYFELGHFGEIEKNLIQKYQYLWFLKLLSFINERNENELIYALTDSEDKVTREWFALLTGYNIKYQAKRKAIEMIREFIYGKEKN